MFWKILHNATAILPKPLLRLLPQVTQTFLSRPMSSRILPDAELQMRLGRAKNLLGESLFDKVTNMEPQIFLLTDILAGWSDWRLANR
jgi:hypothetical protein